MQQYATRPIAHDPGATLDLSRSASALTPRHSSRSFCRWERIAHMSHDAGEPTPYASDLIWSMDRSPSTSRDPVRPRRPHEAAFAADDDDNTRSESLSNVARPQRSRVTPKQRPEGLCPGRRTDSQRTVLLYTPDTGPAAQRRRNGKGMRATPPLHEGGSS